MDDDADNAPHDDADDPLLNDVELVRAAPIRAVEWLAPPLVLGLIGIAGIPALVLLVDGAGSTLIRWMLGACAVALIPYAALLARAGWRAWTEPSPETVRRLIRVRLAGLLGFVAALFTSGIVCAVPLLAIVPLTTSVSIFVALDLRNSEQSSETSRLFRRSRPLLLATVIFGIVAPPVAALIATAANLPPTLTTRYMADAIVVPIFTATLLAIALIRRRKPEPDLR